MAGSLKEFSKCPRWLGRKSSGLCMPLFELFHCPLLCLLCSALKVNQLQTIPRVQCLAEAYRLSARRESDLSIVRCRMHKHNLINNVIILRWTQMSLSKYRSRRTQPSGNRHAKCGSTLKMKQGVHMASNSWVAYFLVLPFWRRLFGAGFLAPGYFGGELFWLQFRDWQMCVMRMEHKRSSKGKHGKKFKSMDKLNLYHNCKQHLANIEVVPVSLIPSMNTSYLNRYFPLRLTLFCVLPRRLFCWF